MELIPEQQAAADQDELAYRFAHQGQTRADAIEELADLLAETPSQGLDT
jgi:hypothetical protein